MLILDVGPLVHRESETDEYADGLVEHDREWMYVPMRKHTSGERDIETLARQGLRTSLGVPTLSEHRDVLVDAAFELVRELANRRSLLGWQGADSAHHFRQTPLAPEVGDPNALEIILASTRVERLFDLHP
jgi:hypothetical protein